MHQILGDRELLDGFHFEVVVLQICEKEPGRGEEATLCDPMVDPDLDHVLDSDDATTNVPRPVLHRAENITVLSHQVIPAIAGRS
ncbi:hypothetical protein QSJ18_02185 [Gordonia sp. ABSL1-1]|uniref:hypothetical protein n=1 Tax=Gordonia sp. ABSL1-1 TaxID=3053923 RepID=UPI0025722441|nr:hypothetical protein [Gordonia sp. ABSL1-1]MDL9935546.1 hypothetical protein [Gordonia sp. ABSL1-1]